MVADMRGVRCCRRRIEAAGLVSSCHESVVARFSKPSVIAAQPVVSTFGSTCLDAAAAVMLVHLWVVTAALEGMRLVLSGGRWALSTFWIMSMTCAGRHHRRMLRVSVLQIRRVTRSEAGLPAWRRVARVAVMRLLFRLKPVGAAGGMEVGFVYPAWPPGGVELR
ncbi:hypothetical protein AK812_SmicGene31360 [Symbiodinium microadriaticum]|uniref:Uncharacterized protein n=1 Tax=Symbiodinium microadriaticum TaxID=2951 RepID=A0A1Q9CX03_SYMMI|nr:hypothetical protein AK812_SmicGene31360 [Symbiodinium microadriaticum]